MQWAFVVLHVLLPSAVAITAGVGAWRCWRLLQYGDDARLRKLMWFYGLFAVSLLPMVVWTWQLAAAVGDTLDAGSFSHGAGGLHGEFAAAHGLSFLLVAHHALMLASLAVAALAFSPKRPNAVMAAALGLAVLEHAIWIALAVEAVVTLYLAVQAIRNHLARRSPGALQVAAGFLLFFLGHLSIVIFHQPGGARTPIGDLLALIGLVLLVRLLPRPTA